MFNSQQRRLTDRSDSKHCETYKRLERWINKTHVLLAFIPSKHLWASLSNDVEFFLSHLNTFGPHNLPSFFFSACFDWVHFSYQGKSMKTASLIIIVFTACMVSQLALSVNQSVSVTPRRQSSIQLYSHLMWNLLFSFLMTLNTK